LTFHSWDVFDLAGYPTYGYVAVWLTPRFRLLPEPLFLYYWLLPRTVSVPYVVAFIGSDLHILLVRYVTVVYYPSSQLLTTFTVGLVARTLLVAVTFVAFTFTLRCLVGLVGLPGCCWLDLDVVY